MLYRTGSWRRVLEAPICGVAILCALVSCSPTRDSGPASRIGSIQYREQVFQKGWGLCGPERTESCARVRLAYPDIVSGVSWVERTALRSLMRGMVQAPANRQEIEKSGIHWTPEGVADALIEEYREFKEAFPDSAQTWYLEREVEIAHASPRTLGFTFRERRYTGGAHPNSLNQHYCWNRRLRRIVPLREIVAPGSMERLSALGEARFRELKGIEPGASLAAAGFSFREDRFELSHNFLLTEEGILFHWERYWIAPYAAGPTELTLPWEEVRGMVRPEYVPEGPG